MRRPVGRLVGAVVPLSLTLALVAGGAAAAVGASTPAQDPATPATSTVKIGALGAAATVVDPTVDLPRPVRGATAIRLLGDQVDDAAAINDMRPRALKALLSNDPSAWLTQDGRLFYKDPLPSEPVAVRAAPAAAYPLGDTFALHSNPGADHTIFLDFDGAEVGGTLWNQSFPSMPVSQPPWDPSGDGPSFSDDERTRVQAIWAAVAEDYAGFDVDVTTADPGAAAIVRSSEEDPTYGSHVVISPSTGAWDATCGRSCGGIAFLGATPDYLFGGNAGQTGYGFLQPAFVFPQGLLDQTKPIAEAVSHEAGHNMGLEHDGNATEGYYQGHGSWAPIMGGSYYKPITQWSQGSYPGANEQQDDVAVLRSVLGERDDEATETIAGAIPVTTARSYISSRDDVDTFLLGTCTDAMTVTATSVGQNANLDIGLTLLDATGTPVASVNPPSGSVSQVLASGMDATLSRTVPAGTYYAQVDGVGNGAWNPGYDDYGSLGGYTMATTGCDGLAPAGTPGVFDAAVTPGPKYPTVTLDWSAPDSAGDGPVTGYVVTRKGDKVSRTVGPDVRTFTWSGLEYQKAYTVTVTPMNARGAGPTRTLTATTAPYTPPTAPIDLVASYKTFERRIGLTWQPPADLGGAAVQKYDIYIDGQRWWTVWDGNATSVVLPVNFGPKSWDVTMTATNRAGTSPKTPVATVVVPRTPVNDYFEARTVLSGASGTTTGDNTYAGSQGGEPVPPADKPGAGDATVWYSWTAPTNGPVSFATTSADPLRDTTLGVYTGPGLGSLVEVAGSDDPPGARLARVDFMATAGTTYAIAVDGFRAVAGGTGPFGLTWQASSAAPTTTSVAASVSGRSVTLTATVTSPTGTPSGTVRFTEGDTELGTATVEDGRAAIELTGVGGGDHAYVATFVTGSQSHVGSTSVPTTATIAAVATSTSLDAYVEGRSVTLETNVGASDAMPVGTVELREGTVLVGTATLAGGSARVTLSGLPTGDHDYVATYVPADARVFAGSTSIPARATIAASTTSVSLYALPEGNQVTLSVTMSAAEGSGTPAGSVTFREGAAVRGTVTLSGGTAELVLSGVPGGEHTYTATYVPTGTVHAGATSEDFTVTVAPTPTKTAISSTASGRTVTLTATVTSGFGTPVGTVSFDEFDTVVDTVPVVNGTATLVVPAVQPGEEHWYRATFVPTDDMRYTTSESFYEILTFQPSPTTTTLDVTVEGTTVTARIAVSSDIGVPHGSVDLLEGGNPVGATMLVDGSGTVTLAGVSPGRHTYTATFDPWNSSYLASSSTATDGVVAGTDPDPDPDPDPVAAPTTTGLTTTVTGRTVTLTAAVTAVGGTPDGTVLFTEDGLDLGQPVHLTNGTASFTRPGSAAGEHTYTATFLPADPTAYVTSLSGERRVTVLPTATTTTLAGTLSGTTVTLNTQVAAAGEAAPAGTVQLLDGTTPVGSAVVVAGKATLLLSGVAVGRHDYQARFTPDGTNHAGSQSSAVTLTVPPAASTTTLSAPARAKRGSRPVVSIKVTRGAASATGTVVLQYGSKKTTLTLKSGKAGFKLPALKKGKLKLVATYKATATTKASSATRTITVR